MVERDDYLDLSIGKIADGERFSPVEHTRLVKKLRLLGCRLKAQLNLDRDNHDLAAEVELPESLWLVTKKGRAPVIKIGNIADAKISNKPIGEAQPVLSALGVDLKSKQVKKVIGEVKTKLLNQNVQWQAMIPKKSVHREESVRKEFKQNSDFTPQEGGGEESQSDKLVKLAVNKMKLFSDQHEEALRCL